MWERGKTHEFLGFHLDFSNQEFLTHISPDINQNYTLCVPVNVWIQ